MIASLMACSVKAFMSLSVCVNDWLIFLPGQFIGYSIPAEASRLTTSHHRAATNTHRTMRNPIRSFHCTLVLGAMCPRPMPVRYDL